MKKLFTVARAAAVLLAKAQHPILKLEAHPLADDVRAIRRILTFIAAFTFSAAASLCIIATELLHH